MEEEKSLLKKIKNINKDKMKENLEVIVGGLLILLFVVCFYRIHIRIETIYNDNDIVLKYHRFTNVVEIINNSDEVICIQYIKGYIESDTLSTSGSIKRFESEYYLDEPWEVQPSEKIKEKMSHADGYIYVIYNKSKELWESVRFIK